MKFNKTSYLIFLVFFIIACSQKKETEQSDKQIPESKERNVERSSTDSVPVATEDIGRTEWQNPELVLSSVGDLSGMVVADIGAGSGYFTFKMAQSAAKVIALDIDPNALEYIDSQIEIVGEWAKNIETRITPPDEPNIKEKEVDAVLIVNTYFYLPDRMSYLKKLINGMKQNARLVIVDYKIGDTPVGPSDQYKVKPEEIEIELRKVGFKSVNVDIQSLQYQFVISAEKR